MRPYLAVADRLRSRGLKERAERLGAIMALEDGAGITADLIEATAARA